MLRIAADTNCFIDAVDPNSRSYVYLQEIITRRNNGQLIIMISRHSLCQIQNPQEAINLAETCEIMPYYLIGTWNDQEAVKVQWDQLAGTWDDAKRNQVVQTDIEKLAKSGTDIRDRGAYVDAMRCGIDIFMTSDKQMVNDGPALRILKKYGLKILTPKRVINEIEGEKLGVMLSL